MARDLDPFAKDVGKPLQEPGIGGHAAIDPQACGIRDGALRHVLAHGLQQVAGLEGDRLEPGSHDVGGERRARQAENRGARLGIPMRRAEPLKGRDEIDAGVGVGLRGQLFAVGRVARSARECRGAIAPWRRP